MQEKYDSTEDTKKHIKQVQDNINVIINLILNNNSHIIDLYDYKEQNFNSNILEDLKYRAEVHDLSKLKSPEKEIFDEFTPKLKDSTYNSDEYKGFLVLMKVGLQHHYKNNSHHPEFYENGIHDMNVGDLLELLADWKAATLRHANGDLRKSLEINQDRFGYDDKLKNILIKISEDAKFI